MSLPKTLQNKRYPIFIRNHAAIKKSSEVKKNFEKIGMADFSQEYKQKAKITLTDYAAMLKEMLISYPSYIEQCDIYGNFFGQSQYRVMKSQMDLLSKRINNSSIKKKNILVMPCTIQFPNLYKGKTVIYEKNTPLLGFINALCKDIHEIFGNEEKGLINCFKALNHGIELELSWNKELKIVFSSHPWDIATMSMRGVSSCQAWGKKQATCLIGSILDPNMAVAYITDGKAHGKYGPRMLARTIVRLVVPVKKYNSMVGYVDTTAEERKTRAYFFEGSYGHFSPGTVMCDTLNDIFRNVVNEKAKQSKSFKKIETGREMAKTIFAIPLTAQIKKLPEDYRSYRDSNLEYSSLS